VEIINLINNARQHVYQKINSELVLLYWNIGNAIKKETLKNKRAEYGKQIIESLSVQLTEEFGKGWSSQQLRHCLRSVETFPEKEILYALSREFNWTQIRTFVYLAKTKFENEKSKSIIIQTSYSSALSALHLQPLIHE
jgi:hypothetical protein